MLERLIQAVALTLLVQQIVNLSPAQFSNSTVHQLSVPQIQLKNSETPK